MNGGPNQPRSPLARFQGSQVDVDEQKRNGWNRHGILVVSHDDNRLSWPERELVKQLGDRLYGQNRRKGMCHA
ncbi:hypothetical protein Mmc1_2764 [Magnetococcus marinus MC-1]|uniref:Uncharacterized protein n=1 Tax=Magnetococcus marinus (strain ATCC BAA-1437 / JCM 17883 / MC-1) TaxID=156889 RepID=A0LBB4_MAGMM|nr:hypothetical protein [Magnetococcus marinus]ABK45257.1 hypothetical protein Mmc1_2764 [Magnetococcus marinus MC-1]